MNQDQPFDEAFRAHIPLSLLKQRSIHERPMLMSSDCLYLCLHVLGEDMDPEFRLVLVQLGEDGTAVGAPFCASILGATFRAATTIVRVPVEVGTSTLMGRQVLLPNEHIVYANADSSPVRQSWKTKRGDASSGPYEAKVGGVLQYEAYLTYYDQFGKRWGNDESRTAPRRVDEEDEE